MIKTTDGDSFYGSIAVNSAGGEHETTTVYGVTRDEWTLLKNSICKEDCLEMSNELLNNLDKVHTTEMGVSRIKRNLSLDTDDVVEWCKDKIQSSSANITRNGKNWYVSVENCMITVNAYSFTIITAHKENGE